MNRIKNFFKRILNRLLGRAEDKAETVIVNKIMGNKTSNQKNNYQEPVTNQPVNNQQVPEANVNASMPSAAQMAAMSAIAGAGANANTEMLKYMKFNEDMEWIGVTDDAPDYIRMAFLKYQKDNK